MPDEITAVDGIVNIQAVRILLATPQRTLENLVLQLPTPMIAPLIVCVVETGIP